MERRALGRSGLSLPLAGLLAGKAFDVRGKEAQSARTSLVRATIERGIDFFATSPGDGDAERVLAAALVGARRRVTVLSMLAGFDDARTHRDIDRSLHYFDGWLDLCLLDGKFASASKLDTLERMREAREARAAGVFCHTISEADWALDAIEDRGLDVIGISAPLLMLPDFQRVIERARRCGAGVLAFLPDVRASQAPFDSFRAGADLLAHFNLTTWRDMLLKLALSEPAVSSAVVPLARTSELATMLEVARPAWFDAAERALLRGGEPGLG